MWMLLTLYLLCSTIAVCFILSACLLSGRISRREEAREKAMNTLAMDMMPIPNRQPELHRGFKSVVIKSTAGWLEGTRLIVQ
jgi:hypothetical protein